MYGLSKGDALPICHRLRRLGTRLLFEIPEQARGLSQGVLERGELERGPPLKFFLKKPNAPMATSARFFTSNGFGEKDWRFAAFAAVFAESGCGGIISARLCWTEISV